MRRPGVTLTVHPIADPLIALDRDLFLEVVTGHPASVAASDELIAERLGRARDEDRS